MKFSNTNASADLNFSICGKTYKVEAGGEVDVDPAHVPYVIRRGLQLEVSSFKPKPKVETPKTSAKPVVVDPKAVAAALVAAASKPAETPKSDSK